MIGMKFKYKRVAPCIIRPIIPIELKAKNIITHEVLVDSGADTCIFDAQIGEILGLPVKSGFKQAIVGVTGKEEPFYLHRITIGVGGNYFNAEVGFMYGFYLKQLGYGIVRQSGFFSNFLVLFDYRKQVVELRPKIDIN